MTSRVKHIDVASGLMIVWMILRHIHIFSNYYRLAWPVLSPYLTFFMPFFFFKSGMFYRIKPFAILLKDSAKKLLVPLAVYSIIGELVWLGCELCMGEYEFGGFFSTAGLELWHEGRLYGNGALWFLWSLFLVQTFGGKLLQLLHPWLVMLIGGIGACTLHYLNVELIPYWVANSFSGLFFYALGHYMRYKVENGFVFGGSVLVYSFIAIFNLTEVQMFSNSLVQGNYILWYPFCVAGVVILINLCKLLSDLWVMRVFAYIGEQAMNFYLVHWIVVETACVLLARCLLDLHNHLFIYLFGVISTIALLPLANMVLRKIREGAKTKSSV